MARYPSRQKRCDEVVSQLETIKGELETIVDELRDWCHSDVEEVGDFEGDGHPDTHVTEFPTEEMKTRIENIFDKLDDPKSDLEALKDEMESWQSNMEGTNLENTEKYERVSECADTLSNAVSYLDDVECPDWEDKDKKPSTVEDIADDIESTINDSIESALSELSNIEFPGMYG